MQHLQLSDTQWVKVRSLHQILDDNISNMSMNDVDDDVLIDVLQSGKWNESAVKNQLAAFTQMEQQERYYTVKYYFGLSQVLTSAQRRQMRNNLIQTATE